MRASAGRLAPSVRAPRHARRRTAGASTPLRGDIQGIRALAVLLVMLNHADIRGLTGGYVGVDVFFVISGFLITGILVREVRRTGRISITDFYARRARRILPAASVVLLAVVVVSSEAVGYLRIDEVLTHVVWAAFFTANIHSAVSGADYFAATTFVSPVQHFWSLAVEEQFYLLWPALIVVILATRRAGGTTGAPDQAELARLLRRLAVAIAVLCALSLAWSTWRTGENPTMAYYSTLTRGWELGLGALLALGATRLARLPAPVKLTASWTGLAAIAYAAVRFTPSTPFPGHHALVPVVGAALVLAGGIDGPRNGARLLLDRQPMRWIGDISYSLYLWHWPFLVLPALYLARDLRLIERVTLMAAAIGVSWLSYRFVETPVRRARTLYHARVKALVMWPVAVAVVVTAVTVVYLQNENPQGQAATTPYVTPSIDAEPETVQDDADPAVNDAAFAAELARAGHPLPAALKPSPKNLGADVSRPPKGCFADREATSHTICRLGPKGATKTMVLFGDSHVTMWLEPLLRTAKAQGWTIIPFMKASCFPADLSIWRADKQHGYTTCDSWRRWAYGEIARIKPDRIITSGLIAQNFTDPSTGRMLPNEASGPLFAAGAQRTLKTLRTLSPQVYAIGGTPTLPKEPKDCLATRNATMGTCARQLDDLTASRNAAWKKAAAATGTHFVDAVPWFCDARTCPLVVRDVIVYRDNNHITRTFATTLQDSLDRALDL